MHPRNLSLASFGICLLPLGLGATAQEEPTVVLLKDGLVRGVLLEESEREIVVRTWVGDKRIARDNIVEIRKDLTATERASILAKINPWKEAREERERGGALAAGKEVVTPVVIAPAKPAARKPAQAEPPGEEWGNPYLRPAAALRTPGNPAHWGERMSAGLDRRITLELLDDKLESALELIGSLTGINIILHPKVRELQPKVTLNVKNMDAANVLKWLAKLTETHIEVGEQALFFTDKASAQVADEEREEAIGLLARHGVDPNVLPPQGAEMTPTDRAKIAMAIWEKENPKVQDFPGPSVGSFPDDPSGNAMGNPFGAP